MLDAMPLQASEWAGRVDQINNFITYATVFFTVTITGVMIYFGIRYRRTDANQKGAYITHNVTMETVWTVIPSIICVGVFVYGLLIYEDMRNPPGNPVEVSVEGYKWGWRFGYQNGKVTSKTLTVPLGRPVRLMMTSKDVIHSFFIPVMRVKEDLYRNNYSYIWFTPTKEGEFHIFCAEYCGTGHSSMLGRLKVVSQEAFKDFLLDRKDGEAPQLPPAELGAQLFENNACVTCHSLDGSKLVGPTVQGLFQKEERTLADGSTVTIDENYVRESITNPNAKIAEGFQQGLMPSFAHLQDDEITALIAYLKTL